MTYEHLYRHESTGGQHLVDHVEEYRDVCNRIPPNQSLGLTPPMQAYLRPCDWMRGRCSIASIGAGTALEQTLAG